MFHPYFLCLLLCLLHEFAMRKLDRVSMVSFCMLLWELWNVRNNKVLHRHLTLPHVAFNYAQSLDNEFCIRNLLKWLILSQQLCIVHWAPPYTGRLEVNICIGWVCGYTGLEAIARDAKELVLGETITKAIDYFDLSWMEARTMFLGLTLASDVWFKDIVT